jgi:hypothetical protein
MKQATSFPRRDLSTTCQKRGRYLTAQQIAAPRKKTWSKLNMAFATEGSPTTLFLFGNATQLEKY